MGKSAKTNGTSRDRTSDLANFNRTLSQLSYRPTWDDVMLVARIYSRNLQFLFVVEEELESSYLIVMREARSQASIVKKANN
jgi:hypothetical protein